MTVFKKHLCELAFVAVIACFVIAIYPASEPKPVPKSFTDCHGVRMAVTQSFNECLEAGGKVAQCNAIAVAKHCVVVEL